MRRTAVVAVMLIGIVVIGSCGWWYHYTGTPQYSLVLLVKAVKGKDYETARYFVDDERMADTISKSVVDALILQFTKKMEADQNPFAGFGVAVIQMMAPRMREMAKEQVKDSIKQAISGDDALTNRAGTQADLKPFSHLRIRECAVSGNTAEVLIEGIQQPNPLDLKQIRLRMARIPNSRSWRIEEIPDVGPAFAKLLDTDALQRSVPR
jgi:hypothetical protein